MLRLVQFRPILSLRLMTRAEAHKVLSLDRDADKTKIRLAYLEQVKSLHPDSKTGDSESFIKITDAYKTLNTQNDDDQEIEEILIKYREMKQKNRSQNEEAIDKRLSDRYKKFRQTMIDSGKESEIISEEEYIKKVIFIKIFWLF